MPNSKSTQFSSQPKLIVGVDYGTTYSGLSFALSTAVDFKDIKPWTKYPGASTHDAEHCVKAPTRVSFAEENPELDENAWGYQIEPGMKTYAWTKLLLDKSALQSDYDDPNLYQTTGVELMKLPRGKSAKAVATEYFRGLYNMFEEAAIERIGEGTLAKLPIEFWLTVPATWSETAKLLTKAAAKDAGFACKPIDKVMLISEPEAAAHMALKSGLHNVEDFVTRGSGVMICDCGGGTVDITTYKVEETKPALKLKEITIGIAGKCGGTFVDRNLFKLLAERFGDAFTSLDAEEIGPSSPFMDRFEAMKKDFRMDNPNRRPHRLRLSMPSLKLTPQIQKFYESRTGSVLLTQDDYKSLFDPVVDMVLGLVKDQIAQVKKGDEPRIETIVLVGGFGSSPYLKSKLGEWCKIENIRLTTPMSGAWSAIVCGAVLRGLEGSIVREKKCRRHYGYSISKPYWSFIHKDYDRTKRWVWSDSWSKEEMLTGFMEWKVKKGDTMDPTSEIESKVTIQFAGKPGTHNFDLYSCSLDDGPATIENERIEKVGNVEYTLSSIDVSKLQSHIDDGVRWYRPLLTVKVKLDDELGHLVFRIFHGEKEVECIYAQPHQIASLLNKNQTAIYVHKSEGVIFDKQSKRKIAYYAVAELPNRLISS